MSCLKPSTTITLNLPLADDTLASWRLMTAKSQPTHDDTLPASQHVCRPRQLGEGNTHSPTRWLAGCCMLPVVQTRPCTHVVRPAHHTRSTDLLMPQATHSNRLTTVNLQLLATCSSELLTCPKVSAWLETYTHSNTQQQTSVHASCNAHAG